MSKIQKIIAITTAAATVAVMSGAMAFAPVASALTAAEIQAQIDQLTAQLAQLTSQLSELEGTTNTGTVTGATELTSFLKRGSKGDEVKSLQTILNSTGHDCGTVDGSFGPKTDAAVKSYQTAKGLVSDGLVGKNTRAALNAEISSGEGDTPPPAGCDCTAWTDDACSSGKMNQTRTCTPSACAAEERSIEDDDCTVPTAEGLTVSLASDNPTSNIIPLSAANVPFLKFKLYASSDGDANISEIVISRSGVGSAANFSNLYLYEGDNRLTSGRTISTQSQKATFSNLSLKISAGSSKTLTVIAEMGSSGTGDAHMLSVASVTADVTVNGVPIAGNTMSGGAQTAGTLTIATSGTPSNPCVGSKEKEVSRFQLTAGSGEDVEFTSIILTNGGSISSSDLTNFKLYRGSDLLAETSSMSNDRVSLVLSEPYVLQKGENRTFTIDADIAGRPDETIDLYIDYTTDLYGVGKTYGAGVGVTNSFAASDVTDLTLQGGKVTVSMSGPSAGKIQTTANDIVMMEYSMTATQDVEVRSTKLYLCWDNDGDGYNDVTSAVQDDITDVKIINADTGAALTGPTDGSGFTLTANTDDVCATNTIAAYKTWTDYYDMNDGETLNLKVTLDLTASDIAATDKIKVVLDEFGANEIKSRITNDYIAAADVVPATDISSADQTVQAASMTVSLASTPVTQTYVKTTEVVLKEMTGFILTAGEASYIEINSISVDAYVDDTTSGTFTKDTDTTITAQNIVDNVYLYVDGEAVAGPESIDADGEINFTNMDLVISAGTNEKLVVMGDITTNAPENGTSDRIKFDITDVSTDMTCYDADGRTVTATGDAVNSSTLDAGTRITLSSAGALYASAESDGATVPSAIILMGTENVTVAQYKFEAVDEGFTVEKLTIQNANSGSGTAGDYDDNIESVTITYPTKAGGSKTDPSDFAGGFATFNSMEMYVPKGGEAIVTVKVNLNTKDGGAQSGDKPELSLYVDSSNDDRFEALSDSGTSLDDDDLYLDGALVSATTDTVDNINPMVVRKSKPTVKGIINKTADASVNTTLDNGNNVELYRFIVKADEAGSIALKKVAFDISINDIATSTALTLNTFKIYDLDAATTVLTATIEDGSGNDITGTSSSLTNGSNQTVIVMFGNATSGERAVTSVGKTFILKAKVASATSQAAGKDSVTVSLKAPGTAEDAVSESETAYLDDDVDAGTNSVVVLDSLAAKTGGTEFESNFIWSDMSAGVYHADTTTDAVTETTTGEAKDWTNAFGVEILPTGSNNVIYPG